MVVTSSREALRGEEVAFFDFVAKTMRSAQWAEWLKVPLELAAAEGNASLSHKLIEAGAEAGSALHGAIGGHHEEVVIDLIENAAAHVDAKDEDDNTPLHVAVRAGRGLFEEVEEGSTGEATDNVWCETAVRLLLRKGADPNAVGRMGTPLHDVCSFGCLGAAKALLEAGADVNIRSADLEDGLLGDEDRRSALDLAAGSNTADMVRMLLEHDADATAAGPNGWTPLHHAAYSPFPEVVDVLIGAGASIEVGDVDNETPLHFAAGRLNLSAVRAFLKHGANVNHLCRFERTPLHKAAVTAASKPLSSLHAAGVVDLLLRSGADETLVDIDGCTAETYIDEELEESMEDDDIVERMRELLANAPADKAWRRRGYWALCRAHPDRLQKDLLRLDNTRTDGQSARSGFRAPRDGAEVDLESNGGSWAVATVWFLELGEGAIFRTIVGYL